MHIKLAMMFCIVCSSCPVTCQQHFTAGSSCPVGQLDVPLAMTGVHVVHLTHYSLFSLYCMMRAIGIRSATQILFLLLKHIFVAQVVCKRRMKLLSGRIAKKHQHLNRLTLDKGCTALCQQLNPTQPIVQIDARWTPGARWCQDWQVITTAQAAPVEVILQQSLRLRRAFAVRTSYGFSHALHCS